MKVTLSEEFIVHGKIYGPGTIDVEDADAARRLQEAEIRVQKLRGHGPKVTPNMTGPLSAEHGAKPQPSNAYTPADAEQRKQESEAVAQAAKLKEDHEKLEAARLAGEQSANPNNLANHPPQPPAPLEPPQQPPAQRPPVKK